MSEVTIVSQGEVLGRLNDETGEEFIAEAWRKRGTRKRRRKKETPQDEEQGSERSPQQ